MKKRSFKSLLYQVLGMENESKWLHSEKVNIFITAIIPAFIGILPAIFTFFDRRSENSFYDLLKDDIFINSMQLVVICCTILVVFRIRRKILVTEMMGKRLSSYIMEKCNLRDQSAESVNNSLDVIRKIMKQLYYAWIALWAVFFVYYSGSLCFAILNNVHFVSHCCELTKQIVNCYNNIFNYLSSTAMFVIFIILNSATVMINERRSGRGIICAVFLIVIFGCVILRRTRIFPWLTSTGHA